MKKLILTATVALTAIAAQFGCGGQPGQPGSDQTGVTEQPATSQPGTPSPGQPASPSAGITIGVQKVDGTPIADIATRPGHDPLYPSPAVADDPLPASASYSRSIYVSTSGSDTADGSQSAPFQTIAKAISVASPGTRIVVNEGSYAEGVDVNEQSPSGLDDQKIILQAQGHVVLQPGRGSSVVHIARAHWVIDGFEIDVQGQPKYAVSFDRGSDGSEITNSVIHHGSLGGGVTTSPGAENILIDNNEIFDFMRNDGHDSHGVVIQPGSKNVVVRNNDIHDVGADSVQCLGPETFPEYNGVTPADGITIEDNLLYNTRENATDIKTCSNVTIRHNRMHTYHANAYAKDGCVIVIHMSAKNVTVEGNEIYDGGKAIAIGGNHTGPVPTNVVVRKNLIHDMITGPGMDGIGVRLENSSGAVIENNTFTNIQGPALVVGHGTGGPTQNLTVENNVIDAQDAISLGTEAPGLKLENNLYRSGAQFGSLKGNVDFTAWQSQGFDQGSNEVASPIADPQSLAPDQSAVDHGLDDGLPHCGNAIDLGAVETGCH